MYGFLPMVLVMSLVLFTSNAFAEILNSNSDILTLEPIRSDLYLKITEAIFSNGKQNERFKNSDSILIEPLGLNDPVTFEIVKDNSSDQKINLRINLWGNNASLSNQTALAQSVATLTTKFKNSVQLGSNGESMNILKFPSFLRGIEEGLLQTTLQIKFEDTTLGATETAAILTTVIENLRTNGVKSALARQADLQSIIKKVESNTENKAVN